METTHPGSGTQPVRQETINNNHIFRITINSTVFTERLPLRQGYLRKAASKVYKPQPWFLFALSSNVYKLQSWFLFTLSSNVYKLQSWFLFTLSSNVCKLQSWFLSVYTFLKSLQTTTFFIFVFTLSSNFYKLQPWFLFTLSLALKRLWRFEFANILFLFSEAVLSRIMTESVCAYTHMVDWAQSTNEFSSV